MKKAFKSKLYLETTGIIFFSSCFVFPLERISFTSFLSLLIMINDTFLKKRIAIHNLIVRLMSSSKVDHSQYVLLQIIHRKRAFSWTLPLFLSTTRKFPSPTRKTFNKKKNSLTTKCIFLLLHGKKIERTCLMFIFVLNFFPTFLSFCLRFHFSSCTRVILLLSREEVMNV